MIIYKYPELYPKRIYNWQASILKKTHELNSSCRLSQDMIIISAEPLISKYLYIVKLNHSCS